MSSPWRWFGAALLLAMCFGDGVAGKASVIWTAMAVFLACATVGWLLRLEGKWSPRRELPGNVVPLRRVR